MSVGTDAKNAAAAATGTKAGSHKLHGYVADFEDKLIAAGFRQNSMTMKEYLKDRGVWFASRKAPTYGKGTFYSRSGGTQTDIVAVIRCHELGSVAGVFIYAGPGTKKHAFKGERPIHDYMDGKVEFPIPGIFAARPADPKPGEGTATPVPPGAA